MNLNSIPGTLSKKSLQKLRSANLSPWAYAILERWATNSPVLLRELERKSLRTLVAMLEKQEEIEKNVLSRPSMIAMLEKGIPEFELLQAAEIKTELEDLLETHN